MCGCRQLIPGLLEVVCLLLLILDNATDCLHNGNVAHQSLLHGLSQCLFSHPVVRSRPAAEAHQNSAETVSSSVSLDCVWNCSVNWHIHVSDLPMTHGAMEMCIDWLIDWLILVDFWTVLLQTKDTFTLYDGCFMSVNIAVPQWPLTSHWWYPLSLILHTHKIVMILRSFPVCLSETVQSDVLVSSSFYAAFMYQPLQLCPPSDDFKLFYFSSLSNIFVLYLVMACNSTYSVSQFIYYCFALLLNVCL